MAWTTGMALLIVGGVLVLQSSIHAQDGAHSSGSLNRIRAALSEQPPLLRVPAPDSDTPTFHVDVGELQAELQSLDERRFDPTFGLPSVGELMMDGIEKIRSTVVNYKRGRAERRAQKQVRDALAAFCAIRGCPPPR